MNTNLLLREEVYEVVNCALEVINTLGHGLHEKPYENSLVVEFRARGIAFSQQEQFPVLYKGTEVAKYIPDLIAYDSVIIDTKVIQKINDHERGQMLNYLKINGLQVGLILNFKHARLEWERIVLTQKH